MNDLSIIQAYTLCAVNKNGQLSDLSDRRPVCFLAAGVLELQRAGCVAIEGKTVRDLGRPPEEAHLNPLYAFIREKGKIKLTALVEAYAASFTGKRLNELLDAVGASLLRRGLLAEVREPGFLSRSKGYIPRPSAAASVADALRRELLGEETLTEETAAVAILLEKADCLNSFFTKDERKLMKENLKNLRASENGKLVRDMAAYLEDMTMAMAVLLTTMG